MKMKSVIVLGIVLLFGTVAFAQDYAKVEVPMYYSFMRFNPENSNVVSGFSLNGGGGGVTVYVNHVFGFTGEFNGYASTTKSFRFPPTANRTCTTGTTVTGSEAHITSSIGLDVTHRY